MMLGNTFPRTRISALVERRAPSDTERTFSVGLDDFESWTGQLRDATDAQEPRIGRRFEPGDVLFGKLRPYLAKVWASDRSGVYVGDFLCLVPRSDTSSRFISYVLRTRDFIDRATAGSYGSKMPRIEWDQFKTLEVPAPSPSMQRRVVDYLDHETAEIDALVSDFQQFRKLLVQSRTSRQNEIFSTYLGSGLADLRGLVEERDDRIGLGAQPEDLLSVSITDGVSRWVDKTDDLPMSDSLEKYKIVEPNDLVLNRMRAFQGGIGVSAWNGITSPDYAVLRPSPDLLPEFAELLIKSDRFVFEIKRRLRGIGSEASGQVRTPRVSVADLVRIPASLPGLAIQRRIVSDWKRFSHEVAAEDSDAQDAIKLAKERRTALISAAVTGKLDVTKRRKPVVEDLEDEVLHKA